MRDVSPEYAARRLARRQYGAAGQHVECSVDKIFILLLIYPRRVNLNAGRID